MANRILFEIQITSISDLRALPANWTYSLPLILSPSSVPSSLLKLPFPLIFFLSPYTPVLLTAPHLHPCVRMYGSITPTQHILPPVPHAWGRVWVSCCQPHSNVCARTKSGPRSYSKYFPGTGNCSRVYPRADSQQPTI